MKSAENTVEERPIFTLKPTDGEMKISYAYYMLRPLVRQKKEVKMIVTPSEQSENPDADKFPIVVNSDGKMVALDQNGYEHPISRILYHAQKDERPVQFVQTHRQLGARESELHKNPDEETITASQRNHDFLVTPNGTELTSLSPEQFELKIEPLSDKRRRRLTKSYTGVSMIDIGRDEDPPVTEQAVRESIRLGLHRIDKPHLIHLITPQGRNLGKMEYVEFENAIVHLPPIEQDHVRQRYEGKNPALIAASFDPPISIRSHQYSLQHALENIDDPLKRRKYQLNKYRYGGRAFIDMEQPERDVIYNTLNVPDQDSQIFELYLGLTTGIPVPRKELGEQFNLRPAQIKERFHKLGKLFYQPNEVTESEV